jgi:broad specificity phosphatase PhoE
VFILKNGPSSILIVRHGQSVRNEAFAKDGGTFGVHMKAASVVPDYAIQLTEKGREQAIALGKLLQKKAKETLLPIPSVWIHSGFVRAADTCALVAKTAASYSDDARFTRYADTRLRERDPGYLYSCTGEEEKKFFPWLESHRACQGWFTYMPPGGESIMGLSEERIMQFLVHRGTVHTGVDMALVMHGGSGFATAAVLCGWHYADAEEKFKTHFLRNCGYYYFVRTVSGTYELKEIYNARPSQSDEVG